MTLNPYFIALEQYVKYYVSPKALDSAKENGTYDKAIMRCVLDFTRMSAPKKNWGISRQELVEDMNFAVKAVYYGPAACKLEGKAYAFINRDNDMRIVYADSVEDFLNISEEIPRKLVDALTSIGRFVELSEVGFDYIVTTNDERLELKYGWSFAAVNGIDRTIIIKQTEAV